MSSPSCSSTRSMDVPTIASLQRALEQVAESIVQFDGAACAWSAHHQSGHRAITGHAWRDFQRFAAQHVTSVRGVRGLKQLVQKELIWLEKHAADMGTSEVPCPSSNAVYICTLWQRAMDAALHQAPIVELDASFPVAAATETVVHKRNRVKPAKVDIVCQAGRRWIRISTLKPIGLLSEFRAAESDIHHDSDQDDDELDSDSSAYGTVAEMQDRLANDELDIAAAQSSIVKLLRDLDQAATTLASTLTFGRPSIDLLLTRLPLQQGASGLEGKFYDEGERGRYEARLRALTKEAHRLCIQVNGTKGNYSSAQSVADADSIVKGTITFPRLPMPPVPQAPAPTKTLHLDLSALIAFVSHVSHMALPARPEEAEARFAKVHWRQEDVDGVAGEDARNSDELCADVEGRGQHARALSEQLRREMTEDCFFDVLIRHLDLDDHSSRLRLTCTREAREKMIEIVSIVGGENEKRRAGNLFDEGGRAHDLWLGSRWSSDGERERIVRQRIVLPVQVLEEKDVTQHAQASQTSFEATFVENAKRSLQLGLLSFDPQTRPLHGYQAVLRQTRHTLTAMLTGLQINQTVLTTNISSIKWLVRDISKVLVQEGDMPGYCDTTTGAEVKAAVWVMYPRSLAEKMALPVSPGTENSDEIAPVPTYMALQTPSDPDGWKDNRQDEPWSKSTSKEASVSSPLVSSLSAGPLAIASTRRSSPLRKCFQYLRSIIAGPRPRAHLVIKHYPWWPLRPLEDAWLRVTTLVAWKDPALKQALLNGDLERACKEGGSYRVVSDGPDEDQWWSGVQRDVRINAVHWALLALTFVGWVLGFAFLSKSLWYEGSIIANDGTRSDTNFFGCTTTFWTANSGCGYNGELCAPFSANAPYDFRCPSDCETTTLGGERAVGDELPAYVPLVVGGGNGSTSDTRPTEQLGNANDLYVYRGDSFVCPAAIHAGVLPRSKGGCGRIWLSGAYSGYEGVERYGIKSTLFNSTFPVSFYFDNAVHGDRCDDNRSDGYVLNVIMLAFVGFVLRPKRIVFFYTLVCVGFWHINFLSYPRQYPMSVGSAMGDFLPTLFVAYGLWRVNFRYTLPPFERFPLESNVWIQGLFWIGVMLNLVFVNVPLNRLVASDIQSEPGALTSLIVIVIVVLVLAVNQVRVIRKVGALPKYLTMAIIGGILVGLLAAVPTTGLRLHHYIIAMVLLPFCAFETRLSLLYSAFLLGTFLNGVARWGYDGLIQDVAIIRGSATVGSVLPAFLPASNWTGVSPFNEVNADNMVLYSNLTDLGAVMSGAVHWEPISADQSASWDSFQLLVDDVLRLQANQTSYNMGSLAHEYITFNQSASTDVNVGFNQLSATVANYTLFPGGSDPANVLLKLVNQPHYLRLAYYNSITGDLGDFTKAATLYFNGSFSAPEPGAT